MDKWIDERMDGWMDDASHEVLSCYKLKFQDKLWELHLSGSPWCFFLVDLRSDDTVNLYMVLSCLRHCP